MKEFLLVFQLLCLAVQLGCLFRGLVNNEDLLKVGYGFAIWGCIPNTLAACIRGYL